MANRIEDWCCFFDHQGIGSGWRLAHVEIGRKWVYVRLHSGSKRVLKMTPAAWQSFPKRPMPKDDPSTPCQAC